MDGVDGLAHLWTPKQSRNRNGHNYKANYFRPCGMNMGIYLKK